jgi:hypothetical protein
MRPFCNSKIYTLNYLINALAPSKAGMYYTLFDAKMQELFVQVVVLRCEDALDDA